MVSDRASNSADSPLIERIRASIAMLSAAHRYKDPYTVQHQHRTSELAVSIGRHLGLTAQRLDLLGLAGVVHDIGKIAVPAEILSRPDTLSDAEFAMVRTHCAIGHDILQNLQAPLPLAEIAYQHHERLDGSGYPRGLSGEGILLEARIIAVADVFDAMTSARPYRAGLPRDFVLGELHAMAGRLLDAQVVEACTQCLLNGRKSSPESLSSHTISAAAG